MDETKEETVAADPWLVIGLYFGYPRCCIDSFMKLRHLVDRPNHSLMGTGFVPCKTCAETKTAVELVEEIKSQRSCTTPFPLGGRIDATEIYEKAKVAFRERGGGTSA